MNDHLSGLGRIGLLLLVLCGVASVTHAETYAEKLGWPAGAKVLILHVDDAGMSAESNAGTIDALEEGSANSFSVMMPTPWVAQIVDYILANPEVDAGLHLTLNAEWDDYRWVPLAGKAAVPGLVDREGALWSSVEQVVEHASADEVGREIAAQLDRALSMGFQPTHLDSHMGTLFASPEFLARYIELGVTNQLPVMFPGGHNYYARQDYGERAGEEARVLGETIWEQGLPVLDDLHNASYGWKRQDKIANYVAAIHGLRAGVTMMIMHCTAESEQFDLISHSGPSRFGDLEAMLSDEVARAINAAGVELTTWRELMQRRRRLQD